MIEDKTNENIVVPIGAHGATGAAIEMTAEKLNPTLQQETKNYNNTKYMQDSIKKLLESGASLGDITGFIKDKRNESVNKALEEINGPTEDPLQSALQWAEEQQKKEWAREDEIRKETQEREDNALQRWVEDARKAGINPNLFNGQGAASGGGITAATGLNMSQYETAANKLLTEWETMVNQEFERNENKKDRFNNLMRSILSLATLGAFTRK